MNLPKMIFNSLEPQDHYGLKILKNGYNDTQMNHTAQNQEQQKAHEKDNCNHY